MRKIKNCSIILDGSKEFIDLEISSSFYRYPFKITLSDRDMILCAQSENVRNIWIVSFSFAIEAAAQIEAKN